MPATAPTTVLLNPIPAFILNNASTISYEFLTNSIINSLSGDGRGLFCSGIGGGSGGCVIGGVVFGGSVGGFAGLFGSSPPGVWP